MSEDIEPIFFLPMDFEENLNIFQKIEEVSQISFPKYNIENENSINIINFEDDKKIENSSTQKVIEESFKICKTINEKSKDSEKKGCLVYSTCFKDPHIKSMTTSSKIYISEIFKRNWKLKSRRIIARLKKKLIKQYYKLYRENIKQIRNLNCTNSINNNINNKDIINFNNNYDNIFKYNHFCINNNIKNFNLGNNSNDIPFLKLHNYNLNINTNLEQNNNFYDTYQ